jgi:hypothetical protein
MPQLGLPPLETAGTHCAPSAGVGGHHPWPGKVQPFGEHPELTKGLKPSGLDDPGRMVATASQRMLRLGGANSAPSTPWARTVAKGGGTAPFRSTRPTGRSPVACQGLCQARRADHIWRPEEGVCDLRQPTPDRWAVVSLALARHRPILALYTNRCSHTIGTCTSQASRFGTT